MSFADSIFGLGAGRAESPCRTDDLVHVRIPGVRPVTLRELNLNYDPPLDAGIRNAVEALQTAGIDTFESCEGGKGHSYAEPTVRFHGGPEEGLRALSVAIKAGLPVIDLRKVWPVIENEPTGPWWELTFATSDR